ncbi:DUF262 domain-containing protein [uncultured Halovibrio sp.]|uniref:DUF262 domain-containing protein n=1 Tax=uncultured Halovibrio sp. TaxID=985049 RepID=UPI0025FECDE1|nr:DUF262 domain-containing protein [uncultured Halovibrio sp.]
MEKYKVSEHDRRTLSWWKSRINNIDFDPPYQRKGGLWTSFDKAYLVDSIINGFDVPKIYLADFTWSSTEKLNPKKKMYAVIDGKQRLEAVFEFLDDRIALNADFKYYANPSFKAGGMKFSDLRKNYPELAEGVEQFNLSVVSVMAQDVDAINELFLRLNRSKPLTGAEIRNAMKGDVPRLIRKLSEHQFFCENIAFSVNRGQDKNAAAKILMFCFYGEARDTKKKDLDDFAGSVKNDEATLELSYRKARDTLDVMSSIFLPRDKLLKSAGLIPVYYLFICDLDESEYPAVRAFLEWFEKERKDSMDERFVNFGKYNRSTNDQNSFLGRTKILKELFKEWRS